MSITEASTLPFWGSLHTSFVPTLTLLARIPSLFELGGGVFFLRLSASSPSSTSSSHTWCLKKPPFLRGPSHICLFLAAL
eukprot:CAMPEP_0169449210 /NCGR_PEP_ID=MMETSP1042-20121227/12483_1 /TAXON_ID=464988 /ORGANISM="Hemiselmis andersenii, Strain CCMP1180" /LENGTH=79 /DNA_ID=CAMNT_0009560921 /DNA_START=225 /DNA_END=460 /DNA_ORIENTATION=+